MENEKRNWKFSAIIDSCFITVGGLTRREAAALVAAIESTPEGEMVELNYERYNGVGRTLRHNIKYWAMVEIPERPKTDEEKQREETVGMLKKMMKFIGRGDEWREV